MAITSFNFGLSWRTAANAAAAMLGFVALWWAARPPGPSGAPVNLHELIHRELALSASQRARMHGLEVEFAGQRSALEDEARRANGELAAAFIDERRYGPKVTVAINHVERATARLQTATLLHIFDMRAILTEGQRARLEEKLVTKSALLSAPWP